MEVRPPPSAHGKVSRDQMKGEAQVQVLSEPSAYEQRNVPRLHRRPARRAARDRAVRGVRWALHTSILTDASATQDHPRHPSHGGSIHHPSLSALLLLGEIELGAAAARCLEPLREWLKAGPFSWASCLPLAVQEPSFLRCC